LNNRAARRKKASFDQPNNMAGSRTADAGNAQVEGSGIAPAKISLVCFNNPVKFCLAGDWNIRHGICCRRHDDEIQVCPERRD